MTTWHVIFTGRVQGVGFRHTCLVCATRLDLTGWVRNLPDGSVEAMIQGPTDRLAQWIEDCRIHLTYGRVDHAEKKEMPETDSFEIFEIRV
jgi:acylphosphatase